MNKLWLKAALIRTIRTFIQTILGVWTAGQLITEIDWKVTLLAATSAAVYAMLTAILAGLPEVDKLDEIQTRFNPDGIGEMEGEGYETEDDSTEVQ